MTDGFSIPQPFQTRGSAPAFRARNRGLNKYNDGARCDEAAGEEARKFRPGPAEPVVEAPPAPEILTPSPALS